ncbi:DUF4240 domain-containing protein [Oerskovia sp. M15]
MDHDTFWQFVDDARTHTGQGADDRGAQDDPLPGALTALLVERLTPDEILAFAAEADEASAAAYAWPVWGAAYLIGGGCSDDGFMDFRDGLVLAGRDVFTRAVTDPDSLAEHPVVLGMAGEGDGWFGYESLDSLVGEAWTRATGRDDEEYYAAREAGRPPATVRTARRALRPTRAARAGTSTTRTRTAVGSRASRRSSTDPPAASACLPGPFVSEGPAGRACGRTNVAVGASSRGNRSCVGALCTTGHPPANGGSTSIVTGSSTGVTAASGAARARPGGRRRRPAPGASPRRGVARSHGGRRPDSRSRSPPRPGRSPRRGPRRSNAG